MRTLFGRRDGCGEAGVATINVVAELHSPVLIHESGLVEEVDRHRFWQWHKAGWAAGGRQRRIVSQRVV
jgi:hypothetical protein